jgi:ATP-dependent Clp protease protease subunit
MAVKSVYIYGEIWDDGVNEKYVQDVINSMEEGDELEVVINSPGGSVFTGLGIYNLIKAHNPVIKIIGLAASIASVIACAGREVHIAENAMIMIHNPWTYAWAGDENYFKKISENLAKIKSQILKAYQQKTGMAEDSLSTLMTEDTWLDSKEALAHGFCDKIFTPGKAEAKALYSNASTLFAASLRNNNSHVTGDDMKIEEAIQKIADLEKSNGLISEAMASREAEVLALNEQISALTAQTTEQVEAITSLKGDLVVATHELEAIKAEKAKLEEEAFCEKLVAEGRMKRDDVESKVAKLLALKALGDNAKIGDQTLYDIERNELSAADKTVDSGQLIDPIASNLAEPEDDYAAQRKEVEEFNNRNKR